MGLFDRLRKDLNQETRIDKTGWENMDGESAPAETVIFNSEKEVANAKRQRAKLIQALLPGEGNPDVSAIAGEPREAGPHDENIVLAKIAMGQIGKKDYEAVLNGIKGPLTDRRGAFMPDVAAQKLEVMRGDKHQLKILAFANGYNVDGHYQDTSISDLSQASLSFQNPIEFEERMAPFMEFLAAHNSPQKVEEYESAMHEVEKTLFGKKYEYYERIKELTSESERIFGKPVVETNNNPERETNHERLVKAGSYYQISRAQVRGGMRAEMGQRLPNDMSCEDSSFIDEEDGFFGVFDGAGGHEGGRRASNIGAETIADLMSKNGQPKTPDELADWLDEASRRIVNDSAAGYSTGTLAKVVKRPDGGKGVIYAQVGDSRLYIVDKNGRATLVTKDEGYENVVTNALGNQKSSGRVCVQAGYRELSAGDKLVLCSDGITGDKGTDLMSEDELGQTVMNAGSTAYTAQALVHQARKNDDRTAIVAEV